MNTVQVRNCENCPVMPSGRCIYVQCRDAVAVGRCHFNDLAPPVPCRTCLHRNPNTGTAGMMSGLCPACMASGYAAWTAGTNVCTQPQYVPQRP